MQVNYIIDDAQQNVKHSKVEGCSTAAIQIEQYQQSDKPTNTGRKIIDIYSSTLLVHQRKFLEYPR